MDYLGSTSLAMANMDYLGSILLKGLLCSELFMFFYHCHVWIIAKMYSKAWFRSNWTRQIIHTFQNRRWTLNAVASPTLRWVSLCKNISSTQILDKLFKRPEWTYLQSVAWSLSCQPAHNTGRVTFNMNRAKLLSYAVSLFIDIRRAVVYL